MQIFRLRDVTHTTGLGRSSVYKFMKLGTFPNSAVLGGKSVGWVAAHVNKWIIQQIRARDAAPSGSDHVTLWAVAITGDDTSEIDLRVLRIRHVMAMTGLARSTVYKYIDERHFPHPVPLAGASVGWIETEVKHWLAKCFDSAAEQTYENPGILSEVA
ncbi:transcriptional regulator, AlpA family [Marinobacter sp. LV10R510-11A]|uniref:AlpA family phage regulatory protein n=1 Tax=Marinobacter sp. LV10R510-11A TaxID=1415568 RepID=UPI000BC0D3B3|nr:AlpA family phage regulatory protein [Marinobacter sp. LV10R510-11A]SOB76011.1 transcriptional regulator, AlpA family [Marinobacter sp. LV10R510-11A]